MRTLKQFEITQWAENMENLVRTRRFKLPKNSVFFRQNV